MGSPSFYSPRARYTPCPGVLPDSFRSETNSVSLILRSCSFCYERSKTLKELLVNVDIPLIVCGDCPWTCQRGLKCTNDCELDLGHTGLCDCLQHDSKLQPIMLFKIVYFGRGFTSSALCGDPCNFKVGCGLPCTKFPHGGNSHNCGEHDGDESFSAVTNLKSRVRNESSLK